MQRAPSDVSRHVTAAAAAAAAAARARGADDDDDDDGRGADEEKATRLPPVLGGGGGGGVGGGGGGGVPALRIARLTKRYDGAAVAAVRDVSFEIARGKVLALCGANGAGKSSLISTITGATRPTRGDAFVGGHSVVHELTAVRRSLGVCTQVRR